MAAMRQSLARTTRDDTTARDATGGDVTARDASSKILGTIVIARSL